MNLSRTTARFANLLTEQRAILISQKLEMAEFFGFETRNKYGLRDESGASIGFAAEQNKGIISWVLRQYLGFWRRYDVSLFDNARQVVLELRHPFRWFYQRLDVYDAGQRCLGAIEWRFFLWRRGYRVVDNRGSLIFDVKTPLLDLWTFEVYQGAKRRGVVAKKWSGVFSELLTDRDQFLVSFEDSGLSERDRLLLIAAAIFTDLKYFEKTD
jgi:uncharacterized protein YxjI